MGGQLDKRMLHWQPATCCIFQLFIIICYLANKVLLLLPHNDSTGPFRSGREKGRARKEMEENEGEGSDGREWSEE